MRPVRRAAGCGLEAVGFPRSCLPRVARRGAVRGSAIEGLDMGGALSLVLIVQATAVEVHRVYSKPRHKPRLR